MKSILAFVRSRSALLAGVLGMALVQTACAHPVAVQPSVVVQARLGGPVYGTVMTAPVYGGAYGAVYGPPSVVMAPQPVYVAPPVAVAPWGWGTSGYRPHHHHWHGQGMDHGWGRRGW